MVEDGEYGNGLVESPVKEISTQKWKKKKIQRLLYNTISNRANLAMSRTEEIRPFAFVPSYQWPQATVFSLILCFVAAKKVQEKMAIYFIHFKFIILVFFFKKFSNGSFY